MPRPRFAVRSSSVSTFHGRGRPRSGAVPPTARRSSGVVPGAENERRDRRRGDPDTDHHDRKPHGILANSITDLVADDIPAAAALASATSVAADACGLGDRKGRLHAGYDADLTVVGGDPRTDIRALTSVQAVYVNGQAAT
jgi:predicted amidohydrolase YtcJ